MTRPVHHFPPRWAEPFGLLLGSFQRLEHEARAVWCVLRWADRGSHVEAHQGGGHWATSCKAWADRDIQAELGKATFGTLIKKLVSEFQLDVWSGVQLPKPLADCYFGDDVPLLLLRNALAHAFWMRKNADASLVHSTSPTQPKVILGLLDVDPLRLRIDEKTAELRTAAQSRLAATEKENES